MGKNKKNNKASKMEIIFDENKRREFLTGFHKRKLERKKKAKEKMEELIKREKKQLKEEMKKVSGKSRSDKPLPEVETILKDEENYEHDDAFVSIVDYSNIGLPMESLGLGIQQMPQRNDNCLENISIEDEKKNFLTKENLKKSKSQKNIDCHLSDKRKKALKVLDRMKIKSIAKKRKRQFKKKKNLKKNKK